MKNCLRKTDFLRKESVRLLHRAMPRVKIEWTKGDTMRGVAGGWLSSLRRLHYSVVHEEE
jgi:hypothetical protein